MSPADVSQIGFADVAFLFGLALLFLAVLVGLEWALNRSVPSAPRSGKRIPARERQLLGDDWRDLAQDFLSSRFVRETRTRFAVYAVTGADPYTKNEAATVERPAPRPA